jgi:hypothetical protein
MDHLVGSSAPGGHLLAISANLDSEMDSITIHVSSEIPALEAHRKGVAGRVRDYFKQNFQVPDQKVLCYFADDDSLQWAGPENRGFHYLIEGGLGGWPAAVQNVCSRVDPDSIVCLHGSTCESDLGLTMTFAHELQHFLQAWNYRDAWAMDSLLQQLVPNETLKAGWETPSEREARIIAKKVAIDLFGQESVGKYIAERIEAPLSLPDKQNWEFVQSLDWLVNYSLPDETKSLVQRYKPELKRLQALPKNARLPSATLDLDSEYWLP